MRIDPDILLLPENVDLNDEEKQTIANIIITGHTIAFFEPCTSNLEKLKVFSLPAGSSPGHSH